MMSQTRDEMIHFLHAFIQEEKVKECMRFFKTGAGQYGEGDQFLGISVPNIRKTVKKYKHLPLNDILSIINSRYHEERMLALLILVEQFEDKKSTQEQQEIIYWFYIKNRQFINNWDLVDITAPKIVGRHLFDKDKTLLYDFANSSNLWEKRISILSTFYFIKEHQFDDALKLADILLQDNHDLIQKAVGWMLREIGKRDFRTLTNFLQPRYKTMPRMMLRYAIEKFDKELRLQYLKGLV